MKNGCTAEDLYAENEATHKNEKANGDRLENGLDQNGMDVVPNVYE